MTPRLELAMLLQEGSLSNWERRKRRLQRIPMNVNPAFNSMYIAEPRNTMGNIAELFQSHPPLEKRLTNLIGRESTGAFRRVA